MAHDTHDSHEEMPRSFWIGIMITLLAIPVVALLIGRTSRRPAPRELTVLVTMDYGQKRPARFTYALDYTVEIKARGRTVDPVHGSTGDGIVRVPWPSSLLPEEARVMVDLRTRNDCCVNRRGPATPTGRDGTYRVTLLCYRPCNTPSL